MDKWKIGDKDERNEHDKMSTESLVDKKIEEKNLQSLTAPVLPSPKKKDDSNLASGQVLCRDYHSACFHYIPNCTHHYSCSSGI